LIRQIGIIFDSGPKNRYFASEGYVSRYLFVVCVARTGLSCLLPSKSPRPFGLRQRKVHIQYKGT
jgi:hypothetical protein